MNSEEILERVERAVQPILETNHVELIELKFRYESKQMVLQFLVDHPKGGITLQECACLNEQMGSLLDTINVIEGVYVLEVSSPGLDRPLKTQRDFERVKGQLIRVIARLPLETKMVHTKEELISVNLIGTVLEMTQKGVVLEEEKEKRRWEISYDCIVKAVRETRF